MSNLLAFFEESATPGENVGFFESVWQSIVTFFTTKYWNILLFFAVLVLGITVIKILLNVTKRLLAKTKAEKITQSFFFNLLKFGLYLILILILCSIVGLEMGGLLTALSAALLAVGLALQNNIANFANGIVIVGTKMFHKGDFVNVNGVEGSVQSINFLFTTIYTTDNKKVIIPNSDIVNNAVTNAGANPTRRVDFTFSVGYESDVETVKKIVADVMKSNGNVRLETEPFCRLKTLGGSSLDFFANCWCDASDYWDVYYYVVENVYNEFKRSGINVPYKQLEVRMREDDVKLPVAGSALPKRVEKYRVQTKQTFDLENFDFAALSQGKKRKQTRKKSSEAASKDEEAKQE